MEVVRRGGHRWIERDLVDVADAQFEDLSERLGEGHLLLVFETDLAEQEKSRCSRSSEISSAWAPPNSASGSMYTSLPIRGVRSRLLSILGPPCVHEPRHRPLHPSFRANQAATIGTATLRRRHLVRALPNADGTK